MSLSILLFSLAASVSFSQDGTMRFAFMTDLHYSKGSTSVDDLRRCIADVNKRSGLDFVLVGGDLTDFGSDEELQGVKLMLDSLEYKYYVVPGNHDAKWSESGCNTFLKVFGYERFEFECKGWRFAGCSCGPDMRMAPALVPREAMEWLKTLTPGRKTIFISHYPQDSTVLNYFDVTRELKRIGTEMVISGHFHANRSGNYDGLPGVICSATLSRNGRSAYNIFTIDGDEVTVSEVSLTDGSVEDCPPWYRKKIGPVRDTVVYDADGLPSSYPWMRYDVNDPETVEEVWKCRDVSNIASGFAVDGKRGCAWYATTDGMVKCISLKDGKARWSRQLPGKVFSTPCLDGRNLFIGCADGNVYSLDGRTGKLRWKTSASKSVLASPVIAGGKVLIGASDGIFRALDADDGSLVWEYSGVEGFVECRPYADAEQVVFGSWGRKLYSLDPDDGRLQWTWTSQRSSRMYSPAAVWPVKADGKIFIAVPDRRLYVLDAATGEEIRHFEGVARESVGISDDGSMVFCKSMWHTLTSVDTRTTDVLWQTETGMGYDISPTSIAHAGKAGCVIMPTDKGNIAAFDAVNGECLWKHKIGNALVNPISVMSISSKYTGLLLSTMDGCLALLKFRNRPSAVIPQRDNRF